MSASKIHKKRRLVATALVPTLVVSVLGAVNVLTAAPAPADIGNLPLITYNMQGASSGVDSKWATHIRNYANQAQVVALQEVGPTGPAPTRDTNNVIITGDQLLTGGAALPAVGLANRVTHSQWPSGTRGVNLDVYFLQTDPQRSNGVATFQGGRVNLAMVAHRSADAVAALPNPLYNGTNTARATLGLLFGNTWYFDVHARSGGGADAPVLLQTINTFVTGRGSGESWVAIGDFNREPSTLRNPATNLNLLPAGARIYHTGRPTQQSGNELDYAVASSDAGDLAVTRMPGASADHYAVGINIPNPQQPSQTFTSAVTVESMQSGGVLDALSGGTANFTPIDSYRRNDAANQSWGVSSYSDMSLSFQGTASGRCIDITHSDRNPGSGRQLSLFNCTGQASQRWMPEYLGNSEYELHSVLLPNLCMNIAGGQDDPNTGAGLILFDCVNTSNERWVFTPAYLPLTLPLPPQGLSQFQPGPTTLESMNAGGVMDVASNATANNSRVVSFHRNGAINQGWDLNWTAPQTVRFQGEGSNRCLDIHNSQRVHPGRELVVFDCTGQASQQWHADDQINGTERFENVAYPNLCLDVAGNPNNPDRGHLDAYPCTGQANQSWIFTPFDPDGAPTADQDIQDPPNG